MALVGRMNAALDLSPYGLRLPLGGLTPQTDLSALGLDIFASARSHRKGVEIDGHHYNLIKKVADGEFGYIYKVERHGIPYACKIHKALKTKEDLQSLLYETLIHILLLQASVGERNGPYVPYLYKIGYDKKTHKTYLLTEWVSHTLHEEIIGHSKNENDRRLPTILGQVAKALDFLGAHLRFNHRDLHPSNVMIARSFQRVVLIDFGYSCLTWNGLHIRGPSLYDYAPKKNDAPKEWKPNPCYKPDRDMPFLCMRLYKFYDEHLSPSMLEHIHATLRGYVAGKSFLNRAPDAKEKQPCDLGELCPSLGLSDIMDQYEFLNSPAVRVPPGATATVERAFRTLRVGHNRNHNRNHNGRRNTRRNRVTLPANRNIRTIPADS
jgi:hypothetical protein